MLRSHETAGYNSGSHLAGGIRSRARRVSPQLIRISRAQSCIKTVGLDRNIFRQDRVERYFALAPKLESRVHRVGAWTRDAGQANASIMSCSRAWAWIFRRRLRGAASSPTTMSGVNSDSSRHPIRSLRIQNIFLNIPAPPNPTRARSPRARPRRILPTPPPSNHHSSRLESATDYACARRTTARSGRTNSP